MKNKEKNKLYPILAFSIPFLVYFLAFYFKGLFTNRMFMYDYLQQYYPLFTYLKDLFSGDASLFYDYTYNLGGTLFGTFFYYLSSPFNLLILLISKKDIINFMNMLIIVKISLSGLAMYYYLKRKVGKDNSLNLIFSLCYVFTGYNLSFIINVFWFDIVLLAPLVLIGLENILDDKSPLLYMITLFLCILANYYMAYMLCIFVVLYYLYELLLKYDLKNDKKIIVKKIMSFLIPSILAGLLCSFFLIPCYLESNSYGRDLNITSFFRINFEYLSIFPKMYLGTSGQEIVASSLYSPNIYCGIIIIPLVYLFLINKNISKKERKYTAIFLIIMFLPCILYGLNFVFHLFTNPIGFNYRYSFLLCLFMILIAYKSLLNLNITFKKILVYVIIYVLITADIIVCKELGIIGHYTYINYYFLGLSFILLITYLILLNKSIKNNKFISIIKYIIVVELIANVFICISSLDSFKREYLSNYYFSKNNNELGRLYASDGITYNDSLLYKDWDVAFNLSTDNGRKKKLYILTNINAFANHFSIMDDLLSVKYIYVKPNNNINDYIKVDSGYGYDAKEKYNLHINPNALSIGYIIKNKCNNMAEDGMYYLYDQKILNCLIDEDNNYYIDMTEYEENVGKIHLKNNIDSKYIAVYISYKDSEYADQIELKYKKTDSIESKFYTKYQYHILKNNHKDLVISGSDNIMDIMLLDYDLDLVNEKVNILAKEQLDYKVYKNYIKGTIETDGGILMLTIPYEKGFEITVDGKKVSYYEVLDTFIGIDLTKGKHEIVIKYKQPGLLLGFIVSFISLILSIIYIIFNHKRKMC